MDQKIEAILLFIQENHDKKITLKKLSDICDINYCYLSSIFKKKTGVSFTKYVKNLKIESAKILLTPIFAELNFGTQNETAFFEDIANHCKINRL